jgi:methionyl aminopeptidase
VIQNRVEGPGYHVVKSLVGHTVGKELHEKPHVPQYQRGTPEQSPLLVPGMTLAIEIIYAYGKGDIVYANDDGWTLATKDRSLSAVFEHTILVNESGSPSVLTLSKPLL